MMEEILVSIYEYVIKYGLNILAAVFIFIVGRWGARILSKFVESLFHRSKLDATLASFVKDIAYFGMMVFVVIAAVNKLGVETTSIVAVVGAAGLAVGLALQGSLANFAAGVVLIILKPFHVGDFVEAAGVLGTVQEIRIFNTVLSSPDNRRVIVPNSKITNDNIVNFSAIPERRVDLIFGISYGDDMKKAKDVLMKILTDHPKVLKTPAPVVAVSELAESSVNLVCRPWVKPQDYWDVYFDVVEKGKVELEKAGITIPFPQRDVHLFQEK